jgi:hypothetical protein
VLIVSEIGCVDLDVDAWTRLGGSADDPIGPHESPAAERERLDQNGAFGLRVAVDLVEDQ